MDKAVIKTLEMESYLAPRPRSTADRGTNTSSGYSERAVRHHTDPSAAGRAADGSVYLAGCWRVAAARPNPYPLTLLIPQWARWKIKVVFYKGTIAATLEPIVEVTSVA